MAEPADTAHLRVRRFDGADSRKFPDGPGLVRGVLDFLAGFLNVLTGTAYRIARAQRESRQGDHKTKSQSLHGTNLHSVSYTHLTLPTTPYV